MSVSCGFRFHVREVPLGFLINADFVYFQYGDKSHTSKYNSLPSRRKQNNVFFIPNTGHVKIKACYFTPWSSSAKIFRGEV